MSESLLQSKMGSIAGRFSLPFTEGKKRRKPGRMSFSEEAPLVGGSEGGRTGVAEAGGQEQAGGGGGGPREPFGGPTNQKEVLEQKVEEKVKMNERSKVAPPPPGGQPVSPPPDNPEVRDLITDPTAEEPTDRSPKDIDAKGKAKEKASGLDDQTPRNSDGEPADLQLNGRASIAQSIVVLVHDDCCTPCRGGQVLDKEAKRTAKLEAALCCPWDFLLDNGVDTAEASRNKAANGGVKPETPATSAPPPPTITPVSANGSIGGRAADLKPALPPKERDRSELDGAPQDAAATGRSDGENEEADNEAPPPEKAPSDVNKGARSEENAESDLDKFYDYTSVLDDGVGQYDVRSVEDYYLGKAKRQEKQMERNGWDGTWTALANPRRSPSSPTKNGSQERPVDQKARRNGTAGSGKGPMLKGGSSRFQSPDENEPLDKLPAHRQGATRSTPPKEQAAMGGKKRGKDTPVPRADNVEPTSNTPEPYSEEELEQAKFLWILNPSSMVVLKRAEMQMHRTRLAMRRGAAQGSNLAIGRYFFDPIQAVCRYIRDLVLHILPKRN